MGVSYMKMEERDWLLVERRDSSNSSDVAQKDR